MTKRIQKEPEKYREVCEIAKKDETFQPYKRWFESKDQIPRWFYPLLHALRDLMGKGYGYDGICHITGLGKSTISDVLSKNHRVISEERAELVMERIYEQVNEN